MIDILSRNNRIFSSVPKIFLDAIDSDSFKNAASGAVDWYMEQLVSQKGMSEEDAKAYVAAFTG